MRLASTKTGVSVSTFIILALSTVLFSTMGIAGLLDRAPEQQTNNNSYTPEYWMKLIMKDGSQRLFNPEGMFLPVKSEYGHFKLPLGSLRAVKFVTPNAGKKTAQEIITRFQSGLIARLLQDTNRNYIIIKEQGKASKRINLNDIMGILGPSFFGNNGTDNNATSDDKLWRYNIDFTDGTSEVAYIPVTVMTIKTPVGRIHLPTPMLYSLKKKPNSKFKYEITTIYGEIIPGNISGNHVRIIADNSKKYLDLSLTDIEQIKSQAEIIPIIGNWLEWYIRPETAIVACFHSNKTELSDGKRQLLAKDVKTITQTVVGIYCNTADGTPIPCQHRNRSVKIALLSTGDIISIPWQNVNAVKSNGQIEAKELVSLMAPNPKHTRHRAAFATNTTTEGIKLKSSIGTLYLTKDDIAQIEIDRHHSAAAVSTVYGDYFLTSIPSRNQLAKITEHDDYEFPNDDNFTLTINKANQLIPATNQVVCRLRSGDLIYARMPQQILKIVRKSRASKTTEINTSSLSAISRNEDGRFYFETELGIIEAQPKQPKIALIMELTNKTNAIPFNLIETITTEKDKLPPPLRFRPEMTPAMRGEIFVEGGSFMQGSETGMDDEQPVHKVTLSPFYIDATEITRNQFAEFIRDSKYKTVAEIAESKQTWKEPGFEQSLTDPVVCVSWLDAAHYCNWRSKKCGLPPCYTFNKDKSVTSDPTSNGYRLPTEAEWEYAARGRGKNNMFACDYDASHNLTANGKDITSADPWMWTCPVKYFPPNSIGLYGMSGNAWEWCQDWYFSRAYLQLRQSRNPRVRYDSAPGLTRRVMRGGSYRNTTDMLRCASRGNGIPFAFAPHVGFRCARSAE